MTEGRQTQVSFFYTLVAEKFLLIGSEDECRNHVSVTMAASSQCHIALNWQCHGDMQHLYQPCLLYALLQIMQVAGRVAGCALDL